LFHLEAVGEAVDCLLRIRRDGNNGSPTSLEYQCVGTTSRAINQSKEINGTSDLSA